MIDLDRSVQERQVAILCWELKFEFDGRVLVVVGRIKQES